MNAQRFYSLLNQFSGPAMTDIAAVKALISEFPFFYPAYALQARMMKELEMIGYEKSLSQAAAYAPDRALLYEFIHAVPVHQEAVKSELPAVSLIETKETITSPLSVETAEPSIPFTQEKPETENKTEEPVSDEKHRLVSIIEQRLHEIEQQQAEQPSEMEKEGKPGIQELEKPAESPLPEIQQPETAKAMTFTGWLKHFAGKGPEEIKPVTEISINPLLKELPVTEKKEKADDNVPLHDVTAIIDKFIAEEPRISTAKPGFYNPSNAARQSVEDHDDIASPTLAQIYLMQGNKERAIEIYRRLILLYPEKSHFFAAQIEKIKHQ